MEVRHWCTNTEQGAEVGNVFYGSDGVLVVKGYNSYEVYLGRRREAGPSRSQGGNHFANSINAVRSRKKVELNAPVETAHNAAALAHLGNIAFRLGRLEFDPASERFAGDRQANELLTRKYCAPFVVPDKV